METSKTGKSLFPMMAPMTPGEIANNVAQHRQQCHERKIRGITKLVVLLTITLSSFIAYPYFRRLPFNSTQWKASERWEELSVRDRMTDDLLDNNKLIGLNHFQVVSLLGKPDQYGLREWDMGYAVGYSVIDPIMLVIRFDRRKRVSECAVETFD